MHDARNGNTGTLFLLIQRSPTPLRVRIERKPPKSMQPAEGRYAESQACGCAVRHTSRVAQSETHSLLASVSKLDKVPKEAHTF